jgi:hypothetical protein
MKDDVLRIISIELEGIDRIEPEFSPTLQEYKVYRKKLSDDMSNAIIHFKICMNIPPQVNEADGAFGFLQYPSYVLDFSTPTRRYGWTASQWNAVSEIPSGQSYFSVRCETRSSGLPSHHLTFNVETETLTDEERAACTHVMSRDVEGEFWGGASGSCTVEIDNTCLRCGKVISSRHDYRD